MIRRRGPEWPTFPAETLRRLFDAVDVNDIVDAHVALPESIVLACPEDSIRRCYALCLQFWKDGFMREEALRLVKKLLRNEALSANKRLEFKYIRARYKHLRFTQRLYSKRHRSDYLFNKTARVLGKLQDAFRDGQRSGIVRSGIKLRVLLSRPVWSMVRRSLENTRLDSEAGLIAFHKAEIRGLKEAMAHTTFAGARQHAGVLLRHAEDARSGRSRLPDVAVPCGDQRPDGARHDEMIAEALSGRRHYDTPAPLANETRSRLETLVARYPL